MPQEVPSRRRRVVQYRRHTRLPDGSVVLLFTDPTAEDPSAVHRSSPVVGVRRCFTPTLDTEGHGDLASFIVATENSEYQVQMRTAAQAHLAAELVLAVV
jgi:hypothetical protein